MSLPWLSDPRRPMVSPREIPYLQAWYDDTDPATILTGSNVPVTDGGAAALIADKSGNSAVNALILNGVAGNYGSAPYEAALDITDDIELVSRLSFVDWGGTGTIIAKYTTVGNQRSYFLAIVSGALRVLASTNGTDVPAGNSTVLASTRFSAYQPGWVKATRTWADGVTRFYTAPDSTAEPASWTKLGDDVVISAGTKIFASTSILEIGSLTGGTSTLANAKIYRSIIRNGIGGTTVFDSDFTTAGKKLTNGDTFVCATGQTVTLNSTGATGARIAGERDRYQGTVANRPTWLQWSGSNYGWLNGTAGNYFSTQDSAAVSITGDITLISKIAAADYTPAANGAIANKWGTAGNRSFILRLQATTGILRLAWTTDGTTTVTADSTVSLSTVSADRSTIFVKCELDVDNGAGAYVVTFSYSFAGTSWTQLGDPVVGASTTSIYDSSQQVEIGSSVNGTADRFDGKIFYVQIYNGINGTLAASFDSSRYVTGPTFVAETGETWTVNGGAHIVTRTGLYGGGVNMTSQSAKWAQAQPVTTYVFGEQVSWTANDVLIDGTSANSGAIVQTTSTPQLNLNAGTSAAANTGFAVKTFGMLVAAFNGAASVLGVNRTAPTTGDAGAGAPNGLTSMADGALANNANMFEGEILQYSGAHDKATRDRVAIYGSRKHKFTV